MTLTPFEASNYTALTSLDDETTFYQELTATGRITVTELGQSSATNGPHPINLVTIDLPETPAQAPAILFVGLMHGDEVMGRETILGSLRDIAETTDPVLLDLMSRCRFYFIPAANPSGFPTSRHVPGRGDMNRMNLSLDIWETQVLQQAITDLDPIMIIDCHEHSASNEPRQRIEFLPAMHPMGDPQVNRISSALLEQVQSDLDDQDIPNGPYAPASNAPYVLRGVSSLRGKMFMLIETPLLHDIIPRQTRYEWYIAAFNSIYDWFTQHLDAAVSTVHAAKPRQAARSNEFDLTNGVTLFPPPSGYQLPAPVPFQLDVLGITHTTDQDGSNTVLMAQPHRSLIPYLLDPEAPDPVVMAERMEAAHSPPLDLGDAQGFRVRTDKGVFEVAEIVTAHQGVRMRIWPPPQI